MGQGHSLRHVVAVALQEEGEGEGKGGGRRSEVEKQGVVTLIRAMHSAATGVTICDRQNSPVTQ